MEIVRDTYIRIACTRTRNSICVRARERERKQGEPERHVGWHGEYGDRKAYPWGVDKIIIGPIIVPSTSRGGFFRSTMQLHFCAFNIIRALSHIQPSPSLNARPLVCPRPSSPHTRAHTPLIGRVLDGSPRGRGGRGRMAERDFEAVGVAAHHRPAKPKKGIAGYNPTCIWCSQLCLPRSLRHTASQIGWPRILSLSLIPPSPLPISLTKCA